MAESEDNSDAIKIVLTCLIFLFAMCGILTPRLFNPFGKKLSYANLIACGVIISAALVHLLSDASQTLYNAPLPKTNNGKPYPWSYFICGISFICLFSFERLLIHQLLHNHHHHGHKHKHTHSHQIPDHHHTEKRLKKITKSNPVCNEIVTIEHNDEHKEKHSESSSLINNEAHHDHHHGEMKEHTQDILSLLNDKNYFSAIVLLFGLGMHSILSGLAIGSTDNNSQIMALGIAVLSHKYLASFALGCPLYKSVKSIKLTLFIAIFFSLLTPIGIIIGCLMNNSIQKNPWISDIFICIASGTFLYVSICEIIIPEFSEEKKIEKKIYQSFSTINYNKNTIKHKEECMDKSCDTNNCKPKQNDHDDIKKILCVFIGFGIMSFLALYI